MRELLMEISKHISLVLISFLAGCLQPDVNQDPLPPWAMDKAPFSDGSDWWMQRTVIRAPINAAFTYVGDGDLSDRIRWKVEEKYLIAYRPDPVIRGGDPDTSGANGYQAPSAIYPIKRHFDVVQGQIVEFPKRAWYERGWFEVDWGAEQTNSHRFSLSLVEHDSASYYVSDPKDADAPVFSPDYLDFTTHVTLASSEATNPEDGEKGYCEAVFDDILDIVDCTSLDVTYRTSFQRVPPNHDYEPKGYDGPRDRSMFLRYWSVGDLVYDDQGRLIDGSLDLKLSRYRIWERAHDGSGARIPYAERKVRAIPFYVSPGTPEDLIPALSSAVDEWNGALESTVSDLRFWECVEGGGSEASCRESATSSRVLVLCPNNPVIAGDPEACGPAGTTARLGDIRYNMIIWETNPTVLGLLGIAWWSPDVRTGETISSHVHVWAGEVDHAAATTRDAVLLAQGRLNLEEIRGRDLELWREAIRNQSSGAIEARRPQRPEPMRAFPVGAEIKEAHGGDLSPLRLPKLRTRLFGPALGTAWENASIDEESWLRHDLSPAELDETMIKKVSPLRRSYAEGSRFQATIAKKLERVGADVDGALDLDLDELTQELDGAPPEEIYLEIRRRLARATFTHELGHALGLRHNFAASYDALNYKKEYWDLRNDGTLGPRYDDPMSEAERRGRIGEYAYASVMDYHPSANAYLHGIGHYDRAAIAWAYGNLVEVFDEITERVKNDDRAQRLLGALINRDLLLPTPVFTIDDPSKPLGHGHGSVHYSKLASIFGDLQKRSFVPESKLLESGPYGDYTTDDRGRVVVPYLNCRDELVGRSPFCMRYDGGADPYEVISGLIGYYRAFYPFNSFRRRRIDFSSREYSSAIWSRVFFVMKNWQNFLTHNRWDFAANDPEMVLDPDGLGPTSAAADLSFDFLARVLSTPDPGTHEPSRLPNGTMMLRPQFFSPSHGEPVPTSTAAVQIALGDGRFYRSDFIPGRRAILRRIGNALDKELALEALLDPSFFNFPGRATWQDAGLWMVNFSNTHFEQVLDLIGSICAGDTARLAPGYDRGSLAFRDFSDPSSTVSGMAVDPQIGFNLRIRTFIYALALLFRNESDSTLRDYARITVAGSGEPGPSGTAVELQDPWTGKVYRATSYAVNGRERGIGARMLLEADRLKTAYLFGPNTYERQRAQDALREQIDLIEIARGLVHAFDVDPFDGPFDGEIGF
jgi:hypothetical protein